MHPKVDFAFHALALDEWRTSFGPTLWNRAPENGNTELRQVWFPGSHSNVGGGFDDQQIATIALACKSYSRDGGKPITNLATRDGGSTHIGGRRI